MNLSKRLNPEVQAQNGDGDVPPISSPDLVELAILRRRIDEIDWEILQLLQRRMEVARAIGGEAKLKLEMPVYDPDREREVLSRAGEFRRVFEAILEVSRDVQRLRVFQQDK
ncbi:chorismate mutase [Thermococcus sp. JCM 11816]|uniref:chorismate mutase n=1 Tax=Thermococcus sp. (strain JCM 11816 / KS-1) TaxID=1295125 RepID=UPI000A4A71A3